MRPARGDAGSSHDGKAAWRREVDPGSREKQPCSPSSTKHSWSSKDWLFDETLRSNRIFYQRACGNAFSNDAGCLQQSRLDIIMRHCRNQQTSQAHALCQPLWQAMGNLELLSLTFDFGVHTEVRLAKVNASSLLNSKPANTCGGLDLALTPIPSNDAWCLATSRKE